MPYPTKAQAKAVLANTSESSPGHRHARAEAKKTMKKRERPGLSSVAKPRRQ